MLRSIPLRIEYRLRLHASSPFSKTASSLRAGEKRKVSLSTGLRAVDLSLEELNFCLEWDEHSPLWVSDEALLGGNLPAKYLGTHYFCCVASSSSFTLPLDP
jgi:hypothetical protein